MTAAILTGPQIAQASLTAIVGLVLAVVGYMLNKKTKQIHVLVNSQMKAALDQIDADGLRITALEQKLGLSPGEEIPSPAIVTTPTEAP